MLAALAFLVGPVGGVAPLALIWIMVFAGGAVAAGLVVERPELIPAGLRRSKRIALALVLFAGYAALTGLWAPHAGQAITRALYLAGLVPVALVIGWHLSTATDAEQRPVQLALALGAAVGSALVAFEFATDMPLFRWANGHHGAEPMYRFVKNREVSATTLLMWPAITILAGRIGRWPAAGLGLLQASNVWLSSSGASTLGLAVGAVVAVAFRAAPSVTVRAAAVAMVAGWALALPIALGLERAGLADAEWLASSMRHRVEIWRYTAETTLDRPFLGHGIAATRNLDVSGVSSRFMDDPTASVLTLHPHNAILQVWLELGAVGAVLGLALTLALARPLARERTREAAFGLAAGTTALAIAATGFGLWQGWWMAMLVITGLAILASGAVNGYDHQEAQ